MAPLRRRRRGRSAKAATAPRSRSSTAGSAPSSTTCGPPATWRASTGDADVLVAITLAAMLVGTWRDLRETWTWAIELAEDPALAGACRPGPDVLGLAADAARLMGDFAGVARYADAAFALADEATDRDSSSLAHTRARASVAPLPRRPSTRPRPSGCGAPSHADQRGRRADLASAALASAYGGDLERARVAARPRPEELMAPIGSLSHHAYRAYVEGESRAPTSIEDAMPYYREAIDLASRAGTSFVEGVARVSLGSRAAPQR